MRAEDREGAQDRDRAAEEAPGRDLERDRGRAVGRRQDLVNSFRLEVLQGTDGCLSAGQGNESRMVPRKRDGKRTSGPKGPMVAWLMYGLKPVPTSPYLPARSCPPVPQDWVFQPD